MTEAGIIAKHREIHAILKEDYYENHLMSKEDFDYLHGQNWDDMEAKLIAEGYRKPPEPERDLFQEITDLNLRLSALESNPLLKKAI